jgi:hypothetical protein
MVKHALYLLGTCSDATWYHNLALDQKGQKGCMDVLVLYTGLISCSTGTSIPPLKGREFGGGLDLRGWKRAPGIEPMTL